MVKEKEDEEECMVVVKIERRRRENKGKRGYLRIGEVLVTFFFFQLIN